MLDSDITIKRKERHKKTQEDFTPTEIVEMMYKHFPDKLYTDFSQKILDKSCGTGNLLFYCLHNRLRNCKSSEDIYNAISSIYGTELMDDNVSECHHKFSDEIVGYARENDINVNVERVSRILNRNIVCTDFRDWDYRQWCPKENCMTEYKMAV